MTRIAKLLSIVFFVLVVSGCASTGEAVVSEGYYTSEPVADVSVSRTKFRDLAVSPDGESEEETETYSGPPDMVRMWLAANAANPEALAALSAANGGPGRGASPEEVREWLRANGYAVPGETPGKATPAGGARWGSSSWTGPSPQPMNLPSSVHVGRPSGPPARPVHPRDVMSRGTYPDGTKYWSTNPPSGGRRNKKK